MFIFIRYEQPGIELCAIEKVAWTEFKRVISQTLYCHRLYRTLLSTNLSVALIPTSMIFSDLGEQFHSRDNNLLDHCFKNRKESKINIGFQTKAIDVAQDWHNARTI